MKNYIIIKNAVDDFNYALVTYDKTSVKAFTISQSSSEWVEWVNSGSLSIQDIRESLDYTLQAELPQHITDTSLESVKWLIGEESISEIKSAITGAQVELVDTISGHGRRYAVKSLNNIDHKDVSGQVLSSIPASNRQRAIEYKARAFRTENQFAQTALEFKKARALWDPDLGPSGGWRCPAGSQYGGYITDRFGRGCGGGIIRRVGRALVNAGRGIDRVGERLDMRRLNRAANRAQKPGIGERLGDANRRVARGAAMALERGAQRLVGDYKPGDGRLESGRRVRRGANAPQLPAGRRKEIDDRLQAISAELDDLVDENPTPEIEKRIGELVRENRALRRERDGGAVPGRGAKPNQVAPGARPQGVRPAVGRPNRGEERGVRRQGTRPVRKPVAERQRDGVMERAARRLVGDYQPDEYKPGDKKRIKNRKNRYADVSDKELARALKLNGRDRNRPGESRAVEARRRQERLEVLQEMVNRGLPIPDEYKREVKVYKLKPQRKNRRDGLNRRGRAAVALERAAQRVLGGEEERNVPDAPRPARRPNAPEARKPEGARVPQVPTALRPQNPKLMSDEALANIIAMGRPRDNFGGPKNDIGRKIYDDALRELRRRYPGLDIEREILLNNFRPNVPASRKLNVAEYTDDELIAMMRRHRTGNMDPFGVDKLSDEDLRRLNDLLNDNADKFPDRMPGVAHAAFDLIGGEFNARQDAGLLKSPKKPSARSRARSARVSQASGTPIRRPQPKRQRGKMLDAGNLDVEQNRRLKEAAMAEKARLDADWRKRLGLGAGEPITSRAIKDYIKQRENNKPGAYIGVLKANANDWDVLDEFEKSVNGRPPGAGLRPDHVELLNKVGPKRRQGFIDKVNAGTTPGRIRSNRPTPRPKTDIPSNRPTRTSKGESQKVREAIDEITGSAPDDRSRRNVRNRFPNNGLPEKAFWRDPDWKGRGTGDREKHEKRFARYYDADGKINARGRLINEQLRAERDGRPMPEAPKPASARAEAKPNQSEPFEIPDVIKPAKLDTNSNAPKGVPLNVVQKLKRQAAYKDFKERNEIARNVVGRALADAIRDNKTNLAQNIENVREVNQRLANSFERDLARAQVLKNLDENGQIELLANYEKHIALVKLHEEAARILEQRQGRKLAPRKPAPQAPKPRAPRKPKAPEAAPNMPANAPAERLKTSDLRPNHVKFQKPKKSRLDQNMGHEVKAGILVPKVVPVGNANLNNQDDAVRHLRDGGNLDEVPDLHLREAILENAAYPGEAQAGKRFILGAPADDGINNRGQRDKKSKTYTVTDTVTGRKYILKTPSWVEDEVVGEQYAALLGQLAGRPMARVRIAGPRELRENRERGIRRNMNVPILVEHFGDILDGEIRPGRAQSEGDGDRDSIVLMRFLDRALGNIDRHHGNYMWAGNEILPIDHGILPRGNGYIVAMDSWEADAIFTGQKYGFIRERFRQLTPGDVDAVVRSQIEVWREAGVPSDIINHNQRAMRETLMNLVNAARK